MVLQHLWSYVRGTVVFLLHTFNTVLWAIPLLAVAVFKLLIPNDGWRRFIDRILNRIANNWVWCNNVTMALSRKTRWDVRGLDSLIPDQWYLILANHQSWLDILVLQRVFYRRIPFLKFFLKKELIWMPVLGLAWWALDYPFMKRYSRAYLEKHPHLAGRDLEITRRACEKFQRIPVSIINFVEGTRFTIAKHRRQESPFDHLLKPKAGGIALVLATMGERLHRVLDVTIAYPKGTKGFWAYLCGKVEEVRVRVDCLPVGKELLGDYFHDLEFRERFQEWVNLLWTEKDQRLEIMLDPSRALPEKLAPQG
ncbi:MAG TPA: acyltransferase [Syntrophobacteraceae bacterium]|nr:acyltransferase [Syntrophobacteraceae bacterium]HBD07604.1 acyltransferase [Syntrophobacteraceae bacterium]HBZ54256.1 acyltransferase [Syntrophobacteraceae bacterium]